MGRRSRVRKGQLVDKTIGLMLVIIGLLLIAALVFLLYWIKARKIELGEDNCPKAGPRAVHVVMFDQSDPITQQQAQRVRQRIEKLKSESSFGHRFDVYTFEADTKRVLQPVIRICSLGRPEEANELIENPVAIRRNYEERFSSVLDRIVDQLLVATTRESSPIIESIRAAAITSFGPFERGQIPLRITLISDMIQHSGLYSHFRSEPNFPQLSKTPQWISLMPNLKGATAEILYLLRHTASRGGRPIQNRGHELFWEQLIGASNGQVNGMEPI